MSAKIKVEKKANPINEPAENLTGRSFRDENDESKNREIETSLSEIYRDSSGNKIDVNRMKIRRKQGLIFWFFNLLVFALVVIVIGLGGYYYFFYGKGTDATALALNIDSPAAVSANQEFTYTIDYKNQEYVAIKSATLEVDYPANFVYLGATPAPDSNDNSWNVGRLNARSDGKIVIRGKIIDQVNATAVMLARMIYTPENFSSEFKKENSVSTLVKDIGFDTTFDYQATALVNDPENLTLTFKPLSQNFFSEFTLNLATDNNIEIGEASALTSPGENSSSSLSVKKIANSQQNAWRISGLDGQDESLVIKYRVKEKTTDTENIKITLSATSSTAEGEKSFVFLEKNLSLEVMKSDLNLNLILNGSSEGQPVDFGQKLNYSITYANKGETSMTNVVIMAVLDSDFVDWTTLQDENQGREAGNTLTWTKAEIPSLEKVGVGEQGTIDFSVNVLPFKESDLGKDFKITSYAQYTIGGLDNLGGVSTSTASSSTAFDNRSNKIECLINSDLGFKEQVRYFDENNLPVGNGPLPPTVGEQTSFKVYWDLTNNLHDLNDVVLETILPPEVTWDTHNRTSVGTISYDQATNKVTWNIGRLPITVFRADAEFNIALTPTESDRNKIVVLLAGTKISATDANTNAPLEKNSVPKTTKLEDDEIANMSSDGRVR